MAARAQEATVLTTSDLIDHGPRLLTAGEEVELSAALAAMHGADPGAYQRGLAARDRLVLSNLRLVRSMAQSFQTLHLTADDLFQEGVVGLMRAVDGFDGSRGFKFSTYAHAWIKKALIEAVERGEHSVRLSTHAYDMKNKVRLARSHGLSEEQIAQEAGVTTALVRSLTNWDRGIDSLDREVVEGRTLADLLAVDQVLEEEVVARAEVHGLLGQLPLELAAALAHEFGIGGYPVPEAGAERLARKALQLLSQQAQPELDAA